MITIYKYTLDPESSNYIETHAGALPLSVGNQRDELCLWCRVNTLAPKEKMKIHVKGTGHAFPVDPAERKGFRFIGSVIIEPFVWHVLYEDNY